MSSASVAAELLGLPSVTRSPPCELGTMDTSLSCRPGATLSRSLFIRSLLGPGVLVAAGELLIASALRLPPKSDCFPWLPFSSSSESSSC